MKGRFLIIGLYITVNAVLSFTVLKSGGSDGFPKDRAALAIRNVGHQLLWHIGDSSSRVLPVTQVTDNTFKLEFKSAFSFSPDTLVKIVRHSLAAINPTPDYLVNVFDCGTDQVVYGFEISRQRKDLVPCVGRLQPEKCYFIHITFEGVSASHVDHPYYLYGLMLVGLTLVTLVTRKPRPQAKQESPAETMMIRFGKYSFLPFKRQLQIDLNTIDLSDKESRILEILALQPNQLITRDELLKRVWEDEGVFTGRSLDVFISKLRKKLKNDPTVRITNIHGKGYTLEIE
ncbi:winged helix-turn-helix transcriptional regulator [Fulvivirga sp. M361]|uniref:winged helix-turn-helix domain-containing protein n=1 Tax=Fulvivirga sp. M361 TaxID=2594266 RepID=UPI00117A8EBA|nr:winged helix-turn-helix domain-containing protein [Fulvivirga sp. M361]TRX49332.1 winged helix-turn-helix transcriptional regulator [Fulvivirga sp. M361]